MTSQRVLQLDVSSRPINLISWKRAITMLWEGRAQSLMDHPEAVIRTPTTEFSYPLIVQTFEYVELKPLRHNQIVRRVLFARDRYTCQYCEDPVTLRSGTIDHVKPRSAYIREGRSRTEAHRWDNVVVACEACNLKKGNRLPRECGMMPVSTPKIPSYVMTVWAGRSLDAIQAEYVANYYRLTPEDLCLSVSP